MLEKIIQRIIKKRVKIGLEYATRKEIAQNELMIDFYKTVKFDKEDKDYKTKTNNVKLKVEQLKDKNKMNRAYIQFLNVK